MKNQRGWRIVQVVGGGLALLAGILAPGFAGADAHGPVGTRSCSQTPPQTAIVLTEGDDVYDGSGATGPLFIVGLGGHDRITGSAFGDTIVAGAGNDIVNGGGGDDLICGQDGNDILSGGAGEDSIYGGDGNDRISGGDDNDFLSGEAGNDAISGGGGDDASFGGPGNDFLNGNAGEENSNVDNEGFNWCINPSPCEDPIIIE
jgi:Ca2+-binding RTX toxin-like protein